MDVILKMLMITFIARTLADICPFFEDSIWELEKYKLDCRNGTTYHCRVYRKQPIHFCHAILVCPPGSFATIDQYQPSPSLHCVPCPDDRFDPEESRSNMKSECQFIRQKCHISEHKIRWKQGNITTDDMCYCDYRAGYEMDADWYDTIPQTSIKICNGITRCVCRKTLRCNAFAETHTCLLPDKTCTEPCPPGYTRPYLSFECVDKESLNINSSTNPPDMPAMPISMPMPKTTLTFPFTISSGCLALAVIVMITVFLRRYCYSASRKGKEKSDAPHPLEELQCESQPMFNTEIDTTNNVDELNLDMR
ncbi:hypothetical protein CHS0354_028453 [Potamilus streckersoni]|uniref:VWFC domain-containing protein n=1 Tax=Potamilus streckersoni TaxID=2493646 RepID=A0AAE0VSB5_9BIVA|nr:hypothetical protein CHS0354_028453 [Potamilus streckersoni]